MSDKLQFAPDSILVDKVKDMERRSQNRCTKPSDARPVNKPRRAEVIQLPLWPDPHRAIPNPFARSALFTIGNARNKRVYLRNMQIPAVGGVVLTYTGEELRQDDEDVFLQLLHIARTLPLGNEVEFVAHAMLKSLRWPTNKPSYERLKTVINRLAATGITIASANGKQGYNGSLIRAFEWREQDGASSRKWKVWLEPRIVALFGATLYTRVTWEQRLSLRNLAKWLHSFYSTHANPYPIKVTTIHQYCGSKTTNLRRFRQSLRSALNELESAGFLDYAYVDENDLVQVQRKFC